MRGYIHLSWPRSPSGRLQAAAAIQAAEAAGHQRVDATGTSWCGVIGPNPPRLHRLPGHALVIGDLSCAAGWPIPLETDAPVTVAEALTRMAWGRYVAIFRDTDGKARSLHRDPSGALEAFAWRSGVLQIVSSATPDRLLEAMPPEATIDWDLLAEMARTPAVVLSSVALRGLTAVSPGEWLDLETGERQTLWRPEDIATEGFRSEADGVRILRSGLDHVVSVLTAGKSGIGAEVSGGLDSAIIMGALTARGVRVELALNTHAAHPETDERPYAEAVAARANVPLIRRPRPDMLLTADMLEASAGDPRPSQNGRDVFNDMAVSEACAQAGITTLLTGKGGDALFFQGHTPLVFSDLWQAEGWRSVRSSLLPGVARWTRLSAWSILAAAHRDAERDRRTRREEGSLLPPAKRLQIALIQSGLAYYSTCRRADRIDMIHPLMSQPLIEWALRTPVPTLVAGGRDRALARSAFADRLPDAVRRRRSKGDYSAYFNHQAAANLPFLRDYLLGGRLAERQIIDRPHFEELLNVDHLRWRGGAAEVLATASLEAWTRRWEARLGPMRAAQTPTATRSSQATG